MAIVALVPQLFLAVAMAATEKVSDPELLIQAEAAFRSGLEVRDEPEKARPHFRNAASCYEALRQRGAHNAELFRNQGNAYLLAGDLPQAMLAYRRGLRLAPTDSILRANLAHARAQVAYPGPGEFGRPATEHWPPWLPYFPLRLGLLLFAGFYSLGWLGLVRCWMVRRAAPLGWGIVAWVLALLTAGNLALQAWNERTESLHPLIVIASDGLPLRKGNGVIYPPRVEAPLNRGVEARLQFERGEWLQIELASGAVGWVPRRAVMVDTP